MICQLAPCVSPLRRLILQAVLQLYCTFYFLQMDFLRTDICKNRGQRWSEKKKRRGQPKHQSRDTETYYMTRSYILCPAMIVQIQIKRPFLMQMLVLGTYNLMLISNHCCWGSRSTKIKKCQPKSIKAKTRTTKSMSIIIQSFYLRNKEPKKIYQKQKKLMKNRSDEKGCWWW